MRYRTQVGPYERKYPVINPRICASKVIEEDARFQVRSKHRALRSLD